MSIPKPILQKNMELSDWNIISAYRGSIAHGMYVPSSDPDSIDDKDVMAVCILPIDYYFGLHPSGFYFEQKQRDTGTKEIMEGEWDIVIYEIRKFFKLLANGNPNVLSMLWLEDKNYLNLTPIGEKLIQHRDLFVGKHVYQSFVGYAKGQMHKMVHGAHAGYMGEKRKQLVSKYGFDTKNCAHAIRLLRMAIEFLTDGKLYVTRHDAVELLDIKKGNWTLERAQKEADRLFDLADRAYINSKLPVSINYERINELCVSLMKEHFIGQES